MGCWGTLYPGRRQLASEVAENKVKMDKEERDLLETYERGEWQSIGNFENEAQRYKEYARATFRKDARINIRISSKDLEALQKRALEEGIPYQTLIASVLHKYVSGRLMERS
jgi:predicted DNA binding CopG/RHH family protein